MDENQLNTIYQEIAETVVETIPEEWSKILIYGEILEDVQKDSFIIILKEMIHRYIVIISLNF